MKLQESDDRKTILIVDDIVDNIQVLRSILGSRYRTKIATSGDKALALADCQEPPDLILLDVMMPGIDGYEVCRELKRRANTRNVPIIFVTALEDTSDEERGFDAAPFYFDKDQVLVNGEPHRFIAAASQWPGRDRITVSVPIRNDSTEDRIAQVTWDVFSWDTLREEQLVTTEETAELVPAGGEVVIEYVLEDVDESVYLVRPSLIYQNEVISQQHIRFAREGVKKPRINFPGVLAYPLTVGAENTLFSCFHNAGTDSVVNDTSLVLKLTDENGATIHTYAYEGDTTGAMMAVADTFTPDRDYGTFTLTTTLSHDGAVVEEVAITYDCAAINEVYCPAVVAEETTDSAGNLWLWYVALGAIVGVGILAVIFGLLLSARVKQQEEDDYYHNNPV